MSANNTCSLEAQGFLSWSRGAAYALPVFGVHFLIGPLTIIQGIYAKYFGLALTAVAMVLLISKLFDAVTDPIIGYLSDRYHAHTGSRKLFVICGSLLFIVAGYFLFVPGGFDTWETHSHVTTGYFLVWFLVFYLAFTLFEIPHLAWGNELAASSQEKTVIYSWRTLGVSLGSLLFFAIPL